MSEYVFVEKVKVRERPIERDRERPIERDS